MVKQQFCKTVALRDQNRQNLIIEVHPSGGNRVIIVYSNINISGNMLFLLFIMRDKRILTEHESRMPIVLQDLKCYGHSSISHINFSLNKCQTMVYIIQFEQKVGKRVLSDKKG